MALQEVTPQTHPQTEKKRRTISLRWLLALVFGGLVGLSLFFVLAVSVYTNFTNTFSLLGESAVAMVSNMENSIRDRGKQAERLLESVQQAHSRDAFEINNLASQAPLFESLMVAAPIVEGILIFDANGSKTGLIRKPDGATIRLSGDRPEEASLLQAMNVDTSRIDPQVRWGDPILYHGKSFINLSIPLLADGRTEAIAVALIGAGAINRVISQLGQDNDSTVFVLDHHQNLVAHSKQPKRFAEQPSYRLLEFPDPILAQMEDAKPSRPFRKANDAGLTILETEGKDGTVFILKDLESYSSKPMTLGTYLAKTDIGDEIFRAAMAAIVGFAELILAVLIAVFLGSKLAKPMFRIATAARHFSNFELEKIEKLPRSRITEIDEQATALNAMRTVMDEFSHYVPKTVVKRLMNDGTEATRSVEREVTIMFTDIVGFTTLTENLNAVETANLLNRHFELICEIITRHNGTIDKFMGDNVMAFWGAPSADPDHAKNALLAAREIQSCLLEDNQRRIAQGQDKLPVRIGVHTGRVVVGNIGGGDRQNYTIVGDSVNIAQRLEQLGKEVIGTQDVVVLLSESVRKASGEPEDLEAQLIPAGSWTLRGREKPVSVLQLIDHQTADSSNVIPLDPEEKATGTL